MTHSLLRLTLLVCTCVAATAAERVVILDPAASRISFTLDTTFHEVHGTMALSAGTIRFDTETGEASGEITVDARTAQSGNKGRDETMHADVLESARYPTIVFRPRRVEGAIPTAGTSEVRIIGVMSLHGMDHPMTLVATIESGEGGVRGEIRFPVPYVEWGLKDPSFFVARTAKTVDVLIHAEGRWER